MTDDGTASKSEFAKMRGVGPSMVTKLLHAGRLVMVGDRVNVAASVAALDASRDPARGGKGGKSDGIPPSGNTRPGAASQDAAPAAPVATDAYTRVRTHREAFRAKTEEIEYRERVGELVERGRYDKALADGLGPVLASLDSLSARLAPALAAETDVRKVQNLIDDAVATIRQDMADTLRRMIAGGGVRQ